MSADAVSILICNDAGTASRTLLARQDLRVRWALTAAEVEAVVALTKCAVCITRESLAKTTLAACARTGRKVATIVLLETEQWSAWRDYFEAGATTVLQASATDQLLDAMSDATGLAFRTAPRITFKTEVRFALGDEGGAWQSLNLSATGICIVGFPPYALGSEVDLAFEIAGKRFEFNAIISQILRVGSQRAVGLAFQDLSHELRANIDDVISAEQRRTRAGTDPTDFDPLDDDTVLALRSSSVSGNAVALMRALTSDGTVARSENAAPWLVAACDSFTAIEVEAVRNPQAAPAWAHDAVLARLRVYQIRWKAGANAPSDTCMREIFGLCQRLADTAAGADQASLVQVANIRAEVLRTLYDPELLDTIQL
jgi:hypothetical protein